MRTWKRAVDLLMTFAFLALMACSLIGEAAHEWIGAGEFLLFLPHHGLNWKWLRHLFAALPIPGGRSWARVVHMLCAYWGFVLMSLHLGLHWGMVSGAIKRKFPSVGKSMMRGAAAGEGRGFHSGRGRRQRHRLLQNRIRPGQDPGGYLEHGDRRKAVSHGVYPHGRGGDGLRYRQ